MSPGVPHSTILWSDEGPLPTWYDYPDAARGATSMLFKACRGVSYRHHHALPRMAPKTYSPMVAPGLVSDSGCLNSATVPMRTDKGWRWVGTARPRGSCGHSNGA
jgi:hypothetical protein